MSRLAWSIPATFYATMNTVVQNNQFAMLKKGYLWLIGVVIRDLYESDLSKRDDMSPKDNLVLCSTLGFS